MNIGISTGIGTGIATGIATIIGWTERWIDLNSGNRPRGVHIEHRPHDLRDTTGSFNQYHEENTHMPHPALSTTSRGERSLARPCYQNAHSTLPRSSSAKSEPPYLIVGGQRAKHGTGMSRPELSQREASTPPLRNHTAASRYSTSESMAEKGLRMMM